MGAIVGGFIGDALGMGVHWYYDLDEMRRECGEWVSGYQDARPGRYHPGLKAGELTQSGIILKLTLRSLLAEPGAEYSEAGFLKALDKEIMSVIDGTPASGPGGYTSQSIRQAWQQLQAGRTWADGIGSSADTTEALERTIVYGARYALDLGQLASVVTSNTVLTQTDPMVASLTVAFNAVLALLVRGETLTPDITDTLMEKVKSGELPFHCVTGEKLSAPQPGAPDPPRAGRFSSPDALITPSTCAAAAVDPHIVIEPAWRASLVYGLPCAMYHIVPACYYLAARFPSDFEQAVLHAVNGGGQNCARAMLTATLAGAQVGLSGIPARFVDGLADRKEILALAEALGDVVAAQQTKTA